MAGFLYVLHSKHYDIDGEDSLYKFGCTSDIASRKFHPCYTTAFKYSCTYKCYWTLANTNYTFAEAHIKRELLPYHDTKSQGTELYNISLAKLVSIVETYLRSVDARFTRYDEDTFKLPPSSISSNPSTNWIDKIMTNPDKHRAYVENAWECDFNKVDLVCPVKCYDCKRQLRKRAVVFHHLTGDRYVGTECARKHISKGRLQDYNEYIMGRRNGLKDHYIEQILVSGNDMQFVTRDNPYANCTYQYIIGDIERERFESELRALERQLDVHYRISFCKAEALAYFIYDPNKRMDCEPFRCKMNAFADKLTPGCPMYDIFQFGISCGAIVSFTIKEGRIWSVRHDNAIENVREWFKSRADVRLDESKVDSVPVSRFEGALDDASPFSLRVIITPQSNIQPNIDNYDNIYKMFAKGIGLIKGNPGTGKSTFIAHGMVPFLQYNGYHVQCLAPTAIAAVRLMKKIESVQPYKEGRPVIDNSRVGDGGYHKPTYTIHMMKSRRSIRSNLKLAFIIDEVSMLDVVLLSEFLNVVGDVPLIFAGDSHQLPPVKGAPSFGIIEEYVPTIELLINHRAEHDKLKELFKQLRVRHVIDTKPFVDMGATGNKGSSYRFTQHPHVGAALDDMFAEFDIHNAEPFSEGQLAILAHKRKTVAQLNKAIRERLHIINTISHEIDGKMVTFGIGDCVMFTHNNYKKPYYNGMTGKIKSIVLYDVPCISAIGDVVNKGGYIEIEVPLIKKNVRLMRDELRDIIHAYAITVHKSQGGDFARVCYIRENSYSLKCSSLDYTAITRTKNHLFVCNVSTTDHVKALEQSHALATTAHRNPSEDRDTLVSLLQAYLENTHGSFSGVFNTVHKLIKEGGYMSPKQSNCVVRGLRRTYKGKHDVVALVNQFTK